MTRLNKNVAWVVWPCMRGMSSHQHHSAHDSLEQSRTQHGCQSGLAALLRSGRGAWHFTRTACGVCAPGCPSWCRRRCPAGAARASASCRPACRGPPRRSPTSPPCSSPSRSPSGASTRAGAAPHAPVTRMPGHYGAKPVAHHRCDPRRVSRHGPCVVETRITHSE